MSNEDMMNFLKSEGIEVKSHLSGLEPEMADLVREHFAPEPEEEDTGVLIPGTEGDVEDDDLEARYEREALDAKLRKGVKKADEDEERGRKVDKANLPPVVKKHVEDATDNEIHLKPPIIVKDLAIALGVKPNTLIQALIKKGVFAAINQSLDIPIASEICEGFNKVLIAEKRDKASGGGRAEGDEVAPEDVEFADAEVETRAPVVTFLGHVDHGKTSLQDKIRQTHVVKGEAGGITQHVGASTVEWQGHKVTFIDTPGHEAFTQMRARGASVTDIAVLVVAADDGFMPQTIEALNHAKAAGVPIIVAMNKMDLPGADPDRVLLHMQQNELPSEDWGGTTGVVKVSAMTGEGLDSLLERIVLEAELLELKANSSLPGRATVLESQLEQGLGSTTNVLVKNGTIRTGDAIICGPYSGRIKALIDSHGKRIKSAGPSTPVKVVGLDGMPECGAVLASCEDEKQARRLADVRTIEMREERLGPARGKASLEDLFLQMKEDQREDLKIILKTDVQGTCEAVIDALAKLNGEKIQVDIILSGVGGITENDVLLASASDALVIGFHVRVNAGVNKIAKQEGVEIRLYSVIYELIEQIRDAMEGMLAPDVREETLGAAKILQIFKLDKKGKVCGCQVTEGVVRVGAKARVYRDSDLIYNGSISSLRRFQDDVKEVRAGMECGIRLDNFNDFEEGDTIDIYEYKETKATLH